MLNAAQIDTAKLETLSEIELRELAATLLARIDRDARDHLAREPGHMWSIIT